MDEITSRFAREVEARGGGIVAAIDDDAYRVRLDDVVEVVVSLENLRRDIGRDGDFDGVAAFVSAIFNTSRPLPPWPEAKLGLRLALEGRDIDLSAVAHDELTPQLAAVLCYTDEDEQLVTFLGLSQLEEWGVTPDQARDVASTNLDTLLSQTPIEIDEVNEARLGMLATHSVFKASLVLAPALKQFVHERIGWPAFAVVPCRDFTYLFADEALIGALAGTVVREHQSSGYPLATEVLRLSDDGIEAIGAFGPPKGQNGS